MIKQNPNPLKEQKTGLMQDVGRLIVLNCLFAVLALLSASYSSFSQKIGDSPSSNNIVQSLDTYNVKDTNDSCILCSLSLPSIAFSRTNTKLSRHAKVLLDTVIVLLKMHPRYNIKISGAEEQDCFPRGRKSKSMLLWDRIMATIGYLVKNGISEDRIIFSYTENDPKKLNLIDFAITEEAKPLEPPPPALNFRAHT